MIEFIRKLLVKCNCKTMNITKIVGTLDDGSEVVLFPVVTPEPNPGIPKITVPLNTPIELVV